MTRGRVLACLIVAVLATAVPRATGAPPRYTIQYLPDVPGNVVQPVAINDLGHVAGYIAHFNQVEFRQPFLWTPQSGYQFLPALPGSGGYSYATGLNNLDQIVGYSGGGIPGPFFWSASTGILELPTPLGSSATGVATGISDDGIVAVNVVPFNAPGVPSPSYFWSKATGAKFLPVLPGDGSSAVGGVNRLGQIVGTSYSPTGATGVIWDHGQTPQAPPASDNPLAFLLISNAKHIAGRNLLFIPGQGLVELSAPPEASTSSPAILGVNASGYAVGDFEFEDLNRAFVYTPADGVLDLTGQVDFGDIQTLGFVDTPTILREADAINDAGVIVGFSDSGPFILTPVPEPAIYALPLVAALLLFQRRRARSTLRNFAGAGAMLVASPAFAGYTPVIFSGAPAPGTENGTTFLQFGLPTLSSTGAVAFQAGLTGPAVDLTNDGAIYSGGVGNLQLLQRKGAPADPTLGPGVKQFVFSRVGYDFGYELGPAISGAQVASFAYFTGPGIDYTNDTGMLAGPVASPALVARYGDHAPGTPAGVHFTGFSLPKINAGGQFVLPARLDGPGVKHESDGSRFSDEDGLWYGNGAAPLQLLARSGDPAPGITGGYLFSKPFYAGPQAQVNASGQVLFSDGLINPPNINDFKRVLYAGTPGNLRKVIATGDPTPGIADSSIRFREAVQYSFNNAGQIAFFGQFSGPGLFAPDGSGIFLATPGALANDPYSFQFFSRSGTPAPGAGGLLFEYFQLPLVNDSGRVVFNGSLTTAGDPNTPQVGTGIWTATSPGDVHLLFMNGTHAPGLPAGDTLSAFAIALTSSGRTLLQGTLSGPDVTSANDNVYYLADADGNLSRLLREGDMLDLGDGILRPATNILIVSNFSGNLSDGNSPFNDAGQLAFRVTFPDDSQGIFIASSDFNGIFIPEPACATVLLSIGFLAAQRRRSRTH